MLLDDPQVTSLKLSEPTNARSIVAIRSGIYAADGDSIFRMATDKAGHKYVGRMDNEAFRLYHASDSTFYACTCGGTIPMLYITSPNPATS